MADEVMNEIAAAGEKLSRSEQRKKNRQGKKGQKKPAEAGAAPQPNIFVRGYTFFVEAKEELTRVVWPTRKETFDTTWRLLVLVLLAGAYLGVVDGILSRILGLLV